VTESLANISTQRTITAVYIIARVTRR